MTLPTGFLPTEALPLLSICYTVNNNTTGVKPNNPPIPVDIPPPPAPESFGWELAYDPKRTVLADNYWQLWQNTKTKGQYALCFRGTTSNTSSIIEDLSAVLVKAKINILGKEILLAEHAEARVHIGFAAGLAAILIDDLFLKLEEFTNLHGLKELYITGHSQGAALATLCRSFLHYQNLKTIFKTQINYKTYIFAQPKPGNTHYAYDFERITSYSGNTFKPMGFRVTSDQDWVPQSPLSLQVPSDVNTPNPFSVPDFINPKLTNILHDIDKLKLHFNFQSAGIPVVLKAKPGSNPEDPNDFFWQHHAQQYYQYLKQQYPKN